MAFKSTLTCLLMTYVLLSLIPSILSFENDTIVVSKKDTTMFTTITKALNYVSTLKTTSRITIYVKRGVYEEYIDIGQANITLLGDGKEETIITGNKSAIGGFKTFYSATVAIHGEGFIAQDLTIRNTAGPENGQVVALKVTAVHTVIYNCTIEGYQDTLYVHDGIQFYKHSDIYGTVDFIFGDASAVFQDCNLFARKPMVHQINVVTAQGRKDVNGSSGIVLQRCNIKGAPGLKEDWPTYLGRPWRTNSRVIVMESFINKLVRPEGWLKFENSTRGLDALFYAEYMNQGPGSSKNGSERVHWGGYHFVTDPNAVSMFTVSNFIDGDSWLPATGIPYKGGL